MQVPSATAQCAAPKGLFPSASDLPGNLALPLHQGFFTHFAVSNQCLCIEELAGKVKKETHSTQYQSGQTLLLLFLDVEYISDNFIPLAASAYHLYSVLCFVTDNCEKAGKFGSGVGFC